MKQFLAVLLSALLLLPLLVSCGETPAPSDGSSEPVSSYQEDLPGTEPVSTGEADPFEGSEPLPADLTFPDTVKNGDGTVIGTIVLPAAAQTDSILTYAAEELQYHLKKVVGADLPVTGRPGDGYGSIILATPETLPLIAEQFADDLAWLADLGSVESGSKFADDGFAIRKLGDDLYVIGNTPRGVLNGVYDLIEENLGVLWIRADEDKGLIYDPMEEAVLSRVDYREKSPFQTRGWWGVSCDVPTERMFSRNKMNFIMGDSPFTGEYPLGMTRFYDNGFKPLLVTSPLYDPSYTGYWNTDDEGNPKDVNSSEQVNFYDQKAIEAIAARVIQLIEENHYPFFMMGEDDRPNGRQVPEDTLPFEYAPGQFSDPSDPNYRSNVFYTFVNKIAAIVKESCPDTTLMTFAYLIGIRPTDFEIADNVMIVYAPMGESMGVSLFDPEYLGKAKNFLYITNHEYGEWLTDWSKVCDNIVVYNYYGVSAAGGFYERPIWYRIQEDFQNYV
ncbi:MAG: DUF4838 domain-containing protein, partial [Clostridia bacterium]|nr:DUF4838 domain-containing protein [Clostridia bacterium]